MDLWDVNTVCVCCPLQEFTGREPDIMEMFTDDLQHESPSLDLTGLPSLAGNLRTVEPLCAFDVIKHVRAWESW